MAPATPRPKAARLGLRHAAERAPRGPTIRARIAKLRLGGRHGGPAKAYGARQAPRLWFCLALTRPDTRPCYTQSRPTSGPRSAGPPEAGPRRLPPSPPDHPAARFIAYNRLLCPGGLPRRHAPCSPDPPRPGASRAPACRHPPCRPPRTPQLRNQARKNAEKAGTNRAAAGPAAKSSESSCVYLPAPLKIAPRINQ